MSRPKEHVVLNYRLFFFSDLTIDFQLFLSLIFTLDYGESQRLKPPIASSVRGRLYPIWFMEGSLVYSFR